MADLRCGKCKLDPAPCVCKATNVCPSCDKGRCPKCPAVTTTSSSSPHEELIADVSMLVAVEVDPQIEGLCMQGAANDDRTPVIAGQLLQLRPREFVAFSWLKPTRVVEQDDDEDDEAVSEAASSSATKTTKVSKKERKAKADAERQEQLKAEKQRATKQSGEERGRLAALVRNEVVIADLDTQSKEAAKPSREKKVPEGKEDSDERAEQVEPSYVVLDDTRGEPSGIVLRLVTKTILRLRDTYRTVDDDPWRDRLGHRLEPPAIEGTIVASRGSQKTEGGKGSSAKRPSISRWLVHTGRMSGDLWHIVGALHFDPSLALIIVWNKNEAKDTERTRALQTLITSLGLKNTTLSASTTVPVSNEVSCEHGAALVRSKVTKVENSLCGHTWASTSLIAWQVAVAGARRVTMAFDELYDRRLIPPDALGLFEKHTIAPVDALLQREARLLFVNMRWVGDSGQNPQHNITPRVFEQIVRTVAAINKVSKIPWRIVRIGCPALDWLKAEESGCIDLYHESKTSRELYDAMMECKVLQPHFWRCVRNLAAERGCRALFFGGRSGGMDIATFMGIRTASWDIVDERDFNYMRLHMLAPMNSVIGYTTHHGIDQGALALWIQGKDFVPALPENGRLEVVGDVAEYKVSKQNALLFPPPP